MNIELGDLEIGTWRDLTPKELQSLKDAVTQSDNSAFADRAHKKTDTPIYKKKDIKKEPRSSRKPINSTGGRRRRGRDTN
jgi:hypothetical protein